MITLCRYIHYQSLMIDSLIVFPEFCCSVYPSPLTEPQRVLRKQTKSSLRYLLQVTATRLFFQSSLLTQYFWIASQKLLVLHPPKNFAGPPR